MEVANLLEPILVSYSLDILMVAFNPMIRTGLLVLTLVIGALLDGVVGVATTPRVAHPSLVASFGLGLHLRLTMPSSSLVILV